MEWKEWTLGYPAEGLRLVAGDGLSSFRGMEFPNADHVVDLVCRLHYSAHAAAMLRPGELAAQTHI